jgi:hypothetical protein
MPSSHSISLDNFCLQGHYKPEEYLMLVPTLKWYSIQKETIGGVIGGKSARTM